MSRTLDFSRFLLAKARTFQQAGFDSQAEELLLRLTPISDLATDVAEEVHARLGEIRLGAQEYRQARRHLAAALAHAPRNAGYHHLMAAALTEDPHGNEAKADACHRRAVKLAPKNAEYLADFGLHALETGERDEAIAALRQACELAGGDAEIVGRIIDGLLFHEEAAEARNLARLARFRNPRDQRFRDLWNDLQFHTLSGMQGSDTAAVPTQEKAPAILPFLRAVYPNAPKGRKTKTARAPSTLKTPRKRLAKADKRHA